MSNEDVIGLGLEGELVSTQLAHKLCEPLGYERPDLVAFPLKVFAESFQPDWMLSQRDITLNDRSSTQLNCRSILPFLESKLSNGNRLGVELTTNSIDSLTSPGNNQSMLIQIIRHLDGKYGNVITRLPNHDIVNGSFLRKSLGGERSVLHVDNMPYVFNRFSTEVLGHYGEGWPAQGLPKVTVTNGFARQGNHISMKIDIPDREGNYSNAVNLLVTSDDPMRKDRARILVAKYAEKKIVYPHDSLMEMTAECAQISIEKGYYPFGAVFSDYEGNLWIGCNATSKDRETKKHAEYIVLDDIPEGTRGCLHTFMAPCPSCAEQCMANNVVKVIYSLGQIPPWDGTSIPLAHTLNAGGEKVKFRPDPISMVPALEFLKEVNGAGGIFKDKFRQTIALNARWLEKLQERRLKQIASQSDKLGYPVSLNPDWGTDQSWTLVWQEI